MTREVVFVGAARTAIGTFGGSLKDVPPADLGALVIKTAMERAGVQPKDVGHVVLGHVIPTVPQDAYISRVAALNAGVPQETPAFNVNRLCGSGLQAIVSAAQSILLGDCDVAIGAGAESMSRGAYLVTSNRWGARMGDVKMLDFVLGALQDPRMHIHMGITAENVAARYDITREQQDAYAVQSQQRAANAQAAGYFKEQIVPVEIKTRKGVVLFDTDEGVKADTTVDALGKMKPAFKKEEGTVTAGNASTLNDGAGAVVMASAEKAKQLGLKPLARLVSYGHAGVEPEYMGIGPVPASKAALAKAGLTVADLDVIESNEAFAAQACAVSKEMGFPNEKTNPNGSGISLGHPVGATGAILVTKALYELQRIKGRYALITMCIGGGQGIAMIIERI
ncbi:acetyl-CoA C-acyltransferase family protein [Aquabacterium sp.]|uniref:acetyl-CoA C-acyltransferase family protein n=1 Tax=Aquabacterium sp. TaxID=1872578 RepID=UPI002488A49A|nr:acetyl-CoA C-acyltransferase family protein [Aquabacterium sp.]MDI1260286.1 acetyl-CoA C-acyltransferase family protein [Aquabacterium sp.]